MAINFSAIIEARRKKKPVYTEQQLEAAFSALIEGPAGYGRRGLGIDMASKTFTDYKISEPKQGEVVGRLKQYAENIDKNYLQGGNILLYGEKGTGKDHLLSALAKLVLIAGYKVSWISGPLLHDVAYRAISEREFGEEAYTNLIYADFLWISDPTLAGAGLSQYQMEWMYKIIDHRSRFLSPTWMTANFLNRPAMDAQLGGPTADRIIDDGLVAYCEWESYRAPL